MRKSFVATDTITKKERHNLVMSPKVWHILSELRKIKSESISTILEDMVFSYLKTNNFDTVYFKIMSSPYCDSNESSKIAEALDSLTSDDLEIVEEHSLINL